ncbi:hypothetical protein EXT46_01300 [Pseudoalteromonas sp. CO325X]|uniref:hypothetical protein n=1 Tax=Pseudoalteromonas sp. CO325X TaxID=1777262 RepID=UPI001023ADA9|nr:hypothetical protein [Pseudoalteromonas sp. CO325X]RZF88114.1 hypothetical protein EXT46_01300 [Pseudoalteromonas sp. CO325X]
MARHLSPLTDAIKRHLINRFAHTHTSKSDIYNLPAPLKLAHVKGQAEFTLRFFAFLERKHILDEQSQWQIWQQLTTGTACMQLVENSGLTSHFNLQSTECDYSAQCFKAFTICFWDAIQTNPQLADKMSHGFIEHFLPSIFTSKPKLTSKDYKRQLASQLYDCWGIKPEIKESFNTGELVEFKLLAKAKGHTVVTLCSLTGKRLNNTREKAYRQTINAIKAEAPNKPEALTPNKKAEIQPL